MILEPAKDLREPTMSGRSLMLESDRQGHFQVEAQVQAALSTSWPIPRGCARIVAALADILPQPHD